jgi:hypothetical protein
MKAKPEHWKGEYHIEYRQNDFEDIRKGKSFYKSLVKLINEEGGVKSFVEKTKIKNTLIEHDFDFYIHCLLLLDIDYEKLRHVQTSHVRILDKVLTFWRIKWKIGEYDNDEDRKALRTTIFYWISSEKFENILRFELKKYGRIDLENKLNF